MALRDAFGAALTSVSLVSSTTWVLTRPAWPSVPLASASFSPSESQSATEAPEASIRSAMA
jgi:hypothetical protein